MQTRYIHMRGSASFSYPPSIPPRIPESPPRTYGYEPITPSASPPRKVVTDFPSFGSTGSASVFGTAVKSSPFSLAGKQAAFGGARGGRTSFEEEEEEESDNAGIGLREDAITFEQVCTLIACWILT